LSTTIVVWILVPLLFVCMLTAIEVGRRIARRRIASGLDEGAVGRGAVEGAVFALFGLLIAFTFSGAASRFDDRRQRIVEEANNIGTAYLRLDLLPADAQPALRDSFRRYVDVRLSAYRKLPDIEAAKRELAQAAAIQGEIWSQAIAATRESTSTQAGMLLLPAINAMIDSSTTRTEGMKRHPPGVIFAMLGLLALACSLFAGFGMAASNARSWIHIVGFAAVMAATIYVIVDFEFPRGGFIRIDSADQVMQDVRDAMNGRP